MKPRISAEKVVLFLIKITQSIPPGDRAAVLESVFAQCRDTPLIMAGIKICDWVLKRDIASIKKSGFGREKKFMHFDCFPSSLITSTSRGFLLAGQDGRMKKQPSLSGKYDL